MIVRKRDKEIKREIIQLHRLCSRSQTIRVCKEEGTKKRNRGKEKGEECKEGKTR